MAKDPAFLFYPGDWLGGTMGMSLQQKGCYMELLIFQFNNDKFSEAQAKQVLSICFSDWLIIKEKFEFDNGFYYNKRLRDEINRRKLFTESRRNNALHTKNNKKDVKAYAKHMEDENETKDIIINTIENRKLLFNKKVEVFINKYSWQMLDAFMQYWTEHNERGKKMRFEMEKVFDISRRLVTWDKRNKSFNPKKESKMDGYKSALEALKSTNEDIGSNNLPEGQRTIG